MSEHVGKSKSAAAVRLRRWLKQWEHHEGENVIHQFMKSKLFPKQPCPKLLASDIEKVLEDFEDLDGDADRALREGDWR